MSKVNNPPPRFKAGSEPFTRAVDLSQLNPVIDPSIRCAAPHPDADAGRCCVECVQYVPDSEGE